MCAMMTKYKAITMSYTVQLCAWCSLCVAYASVCIDDIVVQYCAPLGSRWYRTVSVIFIKRTTKKMYETVRYHTENECRVLNMLRFRSLSACNFCNHSIWHYPMVITSYCRLCWLVVKMYVLRQNSYTGVVFTRGTTKNVGKSLWSYP